MKVRPGSRNEEIDMNDPLKDLLLDVFGRVDEHVHEAVDGLDAAQLTMAPEPGSNPIGWLVWHLTRVQDSHIAELTGDPQVWTTGDWAARFSLAPDPHNHGYGHTAADVATVRPDGPDALLGYHAEVSARTRTFLEGLVSADLSRVVDERWDPPVTMAVRLVSIADDDIQHAGQATYVRGLLERR
jgi:uncharacterized damage-inducible protein DinB